MIEEDDGHADVGAGDAGPSALAADEDHDQIELDLEDDVLGYDPQFDAPEEALGYDPSDLEDFVE